MPPELEPFDTAVLVALAQACNGSLAAHPPIHAIQSRFPKHLRGEVPRSLDRLRRQQYCQKHPTRGEVTWQLTREGLRLAEDIVRGSLEAANTTESSR